MKGILILSHGKMAEGVCDTAKLFMGDNIQQFDYLGLEASDNPAEFHNLVESKIKELNTGDGVIILSDLFGGTPCNQTLSLISDDVDLITGFNLPMILELLGMRMSDNIDLSNLSITGKNGIINIKEWMSTQKNDDDDDM